MNSGESRKLSSQIKREFNIIIAVIGVIPALAFLYLLTDRTTLSAFLNPATQTVLFCVLLLFIRGIISGRKMLLTLIHRLVDFNDQIIELHKELAEKSKLAAITETALALRHEINNPMTSVLALLAIIEDDLKQNVPPEQIRAKVEQLKMHCGRIREATAKLSALSKPVSSEIYGGAAKMIDLDKSK